MWTTPRMRHVYFNLCEEKHLKGMLMKQILTSKAAEPFACTELRHSEKETNITCTYCYHYQVLLLEVPTPLVLLLWWDLSVHILPFWDKTREWLKET